MEFEIVLNIKVDDEANFLEVGETNNNETISEKILSALHDLDDITIKDIDIIRRFND